MDYPFKNFVFEGGGVKGIAYVGALQALQANNVMERIQPRRWYIGRRYQCGTPGPGLLSG